MAKPNIIKIDARNRTEFGKGAARRARVAGDIPVVIYGADLDAPKHILVDTLDFHAVIRNHGVSTLFWTSTSRASPSCPWLRLLTRTR